MQSRLRNYKNALTSFPHNIANLGMHNPGRYCGFDTLVSTGTLAFKLTHAASGFPYKSVQNVTFGPVGMILTRQGVIILEDEEVTGLSVDTNAGNTKTRFDLVVATHVFTNAVGGSDAVYSIIKGPIGDESLPSLDDPTTQVIVGTVILIPGAINLSSAIYQKQRPPDSGDSIDAAIDYPNYFNAIQAINKSQYTYAYTDFVNTPIPGKFWQLKTDGNVFRIAPSVATPMDGIGFLRSATREGMEIDLLINEHVFIRSVYGVSVPSPFTAKYNTFKFDDSYITTSYLGYSAISPLTGENWIVRCQFLLGQWVVKYIGGKSPTTFPKGGCIAWEGDVTTHFDNTGLGLHQLKGWAICNGLNGTRDKRRKFQVMTDAAIVGGASLPDSLYYDYSLLAEGGDEAITLLQANLPDYNLPFDQTPHIHSITGTTNDTAGSGHTPGANPDDEESAGFTDSANALITIHSGGDDAPHKNLPPFITEIFIQKL